MLVHKQPRNNGGFLSFLANDKLRYVTQKYSNIRQAITSVKRYYQRCPNQAAGVERNIFSLHVDYDEAAVRKM